MALESVGGKKQTADCGRLFGWCLGVLLVAHDEKYATRKDEENEEAQQTLEA